MAFRVMLLPASSIFYVSAMHTAKFVSRQVHIVKSTFSPVIYQIQYIFLRFYIGKRIARYVPEKMMHSDCLVISQESMSGIRLSAGIAK